MTDTHQRKPIRKAVFPVAGLGTRFLPATKAIPKEMLPIIDRPLIQYAVDEAREAGIEQLIFVTGRGKTAIVEHFDMASSWKRPWPGREKVAGGTGTHPHPAGQPRHRAPAGAAGPGPRDLVRARDRGG
jgi:UTP--glucose-1-phosphate uridylyltransferase